MLSPLDRSEPHLVVTAQTNVLASRSDRRFHEMDDPCSAPHRASAGVSGLEVGWGCRAGNGGPLCAPWIQNCSAVRVHPFRTLGIQIARRLPSVCCVSQAPKFDSRGLPSQYYRRTRRVNLHRTPPCQVLGHLAVYGATTSVFVVGNGDRQARVVDGGSDGLGKEHTSPAVSLLGE